MTVILHGQELQRKQFNKYKLDPHLIQARLHFSLAGGAPIISD